MPGQATNGFRWHRSQQNVRANTDSCCHLTKLVCMLHRVMQHCYEAENACRGKYSIRQVSATKQRPAPGATGIGLRTPTAMTAAPSSRFGWRRRSHSFSIGWGSSPVTFPTKHLKGPAKQQMASQSVAFSSVAERALKPVPMTGKSYGSYADEWDAHSGRFVDDAPCGGCASSATVLWLFGKKVYKQYRIGVVSEEACKWNCGSVQRSVRAIKAETQNMNAGIHINAGCFLTKPSRLWRQTS